MSQPVYDLITIKGITAFGLHGVYPLERSQGQQFSVDVTMEVDIRQAAATDDLYYTVDYSQVALDVRQILQGTPFNLLESLAETIARKVLSYPLVGAVSVQVHKPQAPLDVQFNDLALQIHRTQAWLAENPLPAFETVDLAAAPAEPVYATIALGANLGDAPRTLAQAVMALDRHRQMAVTAVSGLFKTAPILLPEQDPQPDYYNAVVEVETTLSPLELLEQLQEIEADAGRVRKTRWEARVLDLDILDYDELHCETAELTLPHPRAHERAFVLQPWQQINPQASVGRYGRVEVLVQQVLDQAVEQLAELWVEEALNGAFSPKTPAASGTRVEPVIIDEATEFEVPQFLRPEAVAQVAQPNSTPLMEPSVEHPVEQPVEETPEEQLPEEQPVEALPEAPSGIRRSYLDGPISTDESPIFAELAGRRARMQTEWTLTKHQIDRDWEMRRFAIERELKETQQRIEAARQGKALPEPGKPVAVTQPVVPAPKVIPLAPAAVEETFVSEPTDFAVRIFDAPEPPETIQAAPVITEAELSQAQNLRHQALQMRQEDENAADPQPEAAAEKPDFDALIRGTATSAGNGPRKMPSWKKVVTPPQPRIVDDSVKASAQQAETDADPQAHSSSGEPVDISAKLVDENGNFTSRLQRRQILRPAPTGATPVLPRSSEADATSESSAGTETNPHSATQPEPVADDFGFAPWTFSTDSFTDRHKS